MPNLILFAVCEKAIVDQQTNVISLMSLLEDVNVQLTPGVIPPPNAVVPMAWTAVSIFERVSSDVGKTFEQRAVLRDGSGETLLESAIAVFEMKAEKHRVINQIMGMPVGTAGQRIIKSCIREKGTATWNECGTYSVQVKWLSRPLLAN